MPFVQKKIDKNLFMIQNNNNNKKYILWKKSTMNYMNNIIQY